MNDKSETESSAPQSADVDSSGLVGSEVVYELVDTTDYETYYPVGVFLTMDDAVSAVESKAQPWNLSDQAYDCDCATLEIRERKIGLHGPRYKTVKKWEWRADYTDESEERFELVKPTVEVSDHANGE